jgi:CHASE2 domain-containing sensor protein
MMLFACGTNHSQIGTDPKMNDIILVNAGGERCEVAEIISIISKDKPKAIGVNFLYIEERDHKCDSALGKVIGQSGKVILIDGFENEKHVESNRIFLEQAMFSGPTGLSQNDDGIIDSYYRIIDHRGRWEYSFPFHLALQYDSTKGSKLAGKSRPNDYPITFYHSLKEFKIIYGLEEVKKNAGIFKEKIVIIGSMGQAMDNIFPTPVTTKSTDSTFGTVIIANVVLDILKDLDSDDVPANKYSESIHKRQMEER